MGETKTYIGVFAHDLLFVLLQNTAFSINDTYADTIILSRVAF